MVEDFNCDKINLLVVVTGELNSNVEYLLNCVVVNKLTYLPPSNDFND